MRLKKSTTADSLTRTIAYLYRVLSSILKKRLKDIRQRNKTEKREIGFGKDKDKREMRLKKLNKQPEAFGGVNKAHCG